MDTITHGLLGATVAQLGFRQRIGRDATWVSVLSCVIPDLDILTAPLLSLSGTETDGMSMMMNHRGISHSLFMVPLLSLFIAFFWWWFRKRSDAKLPFWLLYVCVFAALFTHPLLDYVTSYGTQLFAPLTSHRYAADAIAIIDIIYTPILILTLVGCYVARRLKRSALIVGWIGFALSIVYVGAGFYFHHTLASQITGSEVNAYPQLGTIFVWRVTEHSGSKWSAAKVNVLFGSDLKKLNWSSTYSDDNEWTRRAREMPDVKHFQWFAMGQTLVQAMARNSHHIVDFYDMRYGISPGSLESIWGIRVTFDEITKTASVEVVQPHRRLRPAEIFKQVFKKS